MKECHPPIITESEFRAVQEIKKKRSNFVTDDDGTHRSSKKYSSKNKYQIQIYGGEFLLEKVAPANIQELYNLMVENKNLCGTFELADNIIHWNLFKGFLITISKDYPDFYIGIDKKIFGKFYDSFTHWHPSDYEIYSDICKIGTKGNVTVIHKSFLGESILYSGSTTDCKYKRKWLFGRYYYLHAG